MPKRKVQKDDDGLFVRSAGRVWRPKPTGGYGPRRSNRFRQGDLVDVSKNPTTTIRVRPHFSVQPKAESCEWWAPTGGSDG